MRFFHQSIVGHEDQRWLGEKDREKRQGKLHANNAFVLFLTLPSACPGAPFKEQHTGILYSYCTILLLLDQEAKKGNEIGIATSSKTSE